MAFEAGLSISEFYTLTPRQFHNCMLGYEKRQRNGWEQTRMLAFFSLKPHLKKGSTTKAKSIMTFPWDKHKANFTKESVEDLRQRAKEFANKIKKAEAQN